MERGNLGTESVASSRGIADRAFRVVSGLAVAAAPWLLLESPQGVAVLATLAGLTWAATGVVSRCQLEQLIGLNDCGDPAGTSILQH